MKCKAVENGEVSAKGNSSVEWYKGSKPQYYCHGYIDIETDEMLKTCIECRKNINYAQQDLEESLKEGVNKCNLANKL